MSTAKPKRFVFLVSDRTGITAETLGHSLMSQFEQVPTEQVIRPFIDSVDKARAVVDEIDRAARQEGVRPIVFSTMVTDEIRHVIELSEGVCFDFFATFIAPLEKELDAHSSHTIGRSHGLIDRNRYTVRMESVNFALSTDDGLNTGQYAHADVVVTGVSRVGKTPTCLYLAMHYGVFAANYPLVEEDLATARLPDPLRAVGDKVYGLSIQPDRLQQIREQRRPGSQYSSPGQCRREVQRAEALFREARIRMLNTTHMSVEEIAATLMYELQLPRRL